MMWKRPNRSNELYHWGMKRGEKADDHKYVVRIEDGITRAGTPKYKYFYSMAEYKAYKEGNIGSISTLKKDESTNSSNDVLKNDNKHVVDPNIDSYDNSFSNKEVLDNMQKSGYYDLLVKELSRKGTNITNQDEFVDALQKRIPMSSDERFSDMIQRKGLLDEKLPGMHPNSFHDLKRVSKDINDDLDMKLVNYDNLHANDFEDVSANYGYNQNCSYCSLAYDMRQRGYDVEASAQCQNTSNTALVEQSWYKNGKVNKATSSDVGTLEKEILKKNKEGSRGFLSLRFTTGGGHSVIYEVKNGEVIIRDCQQNKKYKMKDYPYASYMSDEYKPLYMRTDNLELTDKALVGVKNR